MNKFNRRIAVHLLLICALSILSALIVKKLILWHPALAVIYLIVTLFSLYALIMIPYVKLQKIMHATINYLHTEMADTSVFNENKTASSSQKSISFCNRHNQTSKAFESDLQATLEYIKQSHLAIEELNQLNLSKRNTLDTILTASHHIFSRDTDEDFYDLILSVAIDVIENATKGSILILNPDSNRYEYQSAVGFELEYLKKVNFSLEETFLYQNSDGKLDQPLIISNIHYFNRNLLSNETLEWLNKAHWLDAKEAISSPIIIDDKIYAILNINSSREHAFDEVDVQLIQFFSAQISIAIRNKLLVDETIKLSKFDNLTGAYNRNYFEKIFDSHNEITLENLEPYAIVLCDLNFLKTINDTFGHTAGDLVLSEFSNIIQSSIEDSDIFSRVGGDEFVLLLKNIQSEHAEKKIAQIFEQYEYHTVNFNGHKLPVSFSYGIASSPDDSMVYDVLVKIADARMYEFKKEYKETHPDILSSILH